MSDAVTRKAYDTLYDLYLRMAEERDAALARITALEAQIAAAGWRPVTEPSETSDRYLVHLIGLDFNGEWIRERYQVATFSNGQWLIDPDVERIDRYMPIPGPQ